MPDYIRLTPSSAPQHVGNTPTTQDHLSAAAGDSPPSSADYVHLSKEVSRQTTPFSEIHSPEDSHYRTPTNGSNDGEEEAEEGIEVHDFSEREDREEETAMPSDLRRSEDDKDHWREPLLNNGKGRPSYDRAFSARSDYPSSRRSSFKERDSEALAAETTRKRYMYAAGFLMVSLVSFAVQTETAVYIQHSLRWNKAYCMMYVFIII